MEKKMKIMKKENSIKSPCKHLYMSHDGLYGDFGKLTSFLFSSFSSKETLIKWSYFVDGSVVEVFHFLHFRP